MNVPAELRYSKSHEWVKLEGETALVGLTDHAQSLLGDIVFVNLPAEGDGLSAGDVLGDVESVKAVSDVYCPVGGTVAEVNEALLDSPQLINEDPYGAWLIRLEGISSLEGLLSAEEYEAHVAAEE